MTNKRLSWGIVAGLLCVLAVVAIQLALFLILRDVRPHNEISDCDLRHRCVLPNGATVQAVGKLSAKQPFRIYVRRTPAGTARVYAEFSMRDMDMGFNRYKLLPVPGEPDSRLANKVRLPVCVTARRDYIMTVYFDDRAFDIPFVSD